MSLPATAAGRCDVRTPSRPAGSPREERGPRPRTPGAAARSPARAPVGWASARRRRALRAGAWGPRGRRARARASRRPTSPPLPRYDFRASRPPSCSRGSAAARRESRRGRVRTVWTVRPPPCRRRRCGWRWCARATRTGAWRRTTSSGSWGRCPGPALPVGRRPTGRPSGPFPPRPGLGAGGLRPPRSVLGSGGPGTPLLGGPRARPRRPDVGGRTDGRTGGAGRPRVRAPGLRGPRAARSPQGSVGRAVPRVCLASREDSGFGSKCSRVSQTSKLPVNPEGRRRAGPLCTRVGASKNVGLL